MSDKTGAYAAAAELGSKLRGEDPGELVRSFAGLVDDKRTLRLLNYYDGLLPPGKSIEETPIGRLIISNAATETMDEAVRHGSVSQMKCARQGSQATIKTVKICTREPRKNSDTRDLLESCLGVRRWQDCNHDRHCSVVARSNRRDDYRKHDVGRIRLSNPFRR